MPSIVVWSKESCVQCNAVYRWLDKKGFKGEYVVEMFEDNPEKVEEFKARGLMQAPIVFVDTNEPIVGFNPGELTAQLLS